MGDLIILADRLADFSRRHPSGLPAFYFDLACPYSYLAAEQVERYLGVVEWIPVEGSGAALIRGAGRETPTDVAFLGQDEDQSASLREVERDGDVPFLEALREHAEQRAAELRLPLIWPDRFPAPVPSALRAAAYATEIGAGHRFALAASRLAFCGGFDLEDPEILAEAAAAAMLPLEHCLEAARDPDRDRQPQATAEGLRAKGVRTLPVIKLGERWFEGDGAPAEAAELLRIRASYGGPGA